MAYELGDLVVLVSGSMRMAVESVDDAGVHCLWCNEGVIGRDVFNEKLLKKWEMREETRGGDRGGKPPFRGDREGGGKPFPSRDRDGGADAKPRGKTGWDGKPREKKFFRKDD